MDYDNWVSEGGYIPPEDDLFDKAQDYLESTQSEHLKAEYRHIGIQNACNLLWG